MSSSTVLSILVQFNGGATGSQAPARYFPRPVAPWVLHFPVTTRPPCAIGKGVPGRKPLRPRRTGNEFIDNKKECPNGHPVVGAQEGLPALRGSARRADGIEQWFPGPDVWRRWQGAYRF